MNVIALLDSVYLIASLLALFFVLFGRRKGKFFQGENQLFLTCLLVTTIIYSVCLFMEWSGINTNLNDFEDIAGALLPLWWAFIFYGFVKEISSHDLKISKEKLTQSEAHLRALVETIPDLIWLKDPQGVYLACNPKFEKFFGEKQADIIGKTDYDFVDRKLADFFRKKDREAMAAGKPSVNEEEITYADDGHKEILETIKTPMFDDAGNLIGVLGIARDITARKRMEKELAQAHKLEAIGTLAGGIAHDFNNILSAIFGYTDLAFTDMAKHDLLEEDLKEIRAAAGRAKDLVKQILTYSRKSEQEQQPLQVSLLIKEALKLIRSSLPATIAIEQNITSGAAVMADPTQIHQVIMNLCTNAYHAMRETGGTLSIALHETEVTKEDVKPGQEILPGRYLQISVADTGCGMDEVTRHKIFEPYFTTKEVGEGTGLGLAVVHGIVQSHKGNITVESEQGSGTTFRILLPIEEDEQGKLPPADESKPLKHGSEHVMFVDDEEDLLNIAQRSLSQYGYTIEIFSNPAQALQALKKTPSRYDIIVTDMAMPSMSGIELIKSARAVRPDLPVILCSGYSELINKEQAETLGIHYFQKPVDMVDIARLLGEIFEPKQ